MSELLKQFIQFKKDCLAKLHTLEIEYIVHVFGSEENKK